MVWKIPRVCVDSDDTTEGFDWNIPAGAYVRYFLLDIGNGHTMLIEVGAFDKPSWEALVADAMPVIDSFTFRK